MVTKVSAELVPLTRDLAQRVCALQPVPGEREKDDSRLKFFLNHLRHKTFGSPTWSIATVKGSNEEFRADGQHTSTVLAALSEDEFPKGLQVTIQRFVVDSFKEDTFLLFDQFDNPKSTRTNADVMCLYRASFEEIKTLNNKFLVKIAEGISYYLHELRSDPNSEPTLTYKKRMHGAYFADSEYCHFAMWLYPWRAARHSWMLGKPGLVAEMLHDWKTAPKIADLFWGYVFREDHPEASDYTRELSGQLKDMASKPRAKQDKFRKQAKKVWERYKQLLMAAESQQLPLVTTINPSPEAMTVAPAA